MYFYLIYFLVARGTIYQELLPTHTTVRNWKTSQQNFLKSSDTGPVEPIKDGTHEKRNGSTRNRKKHEKQCYPRNRKKKQEKEKVIKKTADKKQEIVQKDKTDKNCT